MVKIDHKSLKRFTGLNSEKDFECKFFGMSNTLNPETIAFADSEKFIAEINSNANITVVLCNTDIAKNIKGKVVVTCDDARYHYYNFFNKIIESNYVKTPSVISSTANIHPKAFVSEYNVTIGDNTYVGPNASIMPDVMIGKNCFMARAPLAHGLRPA